MSSLKDWLNDQMHRNMMSWRAKLETVQLFVSYWPNCHERNIIPILYDTLHMPHNTDGINITYWKNFFLLQAVFLFCDILSWGVCDLCEVCVHYVGFSISFLDLMCLLRIFRHTYICRIKIKTSEIYLLHMWLPWWPTAVSLHKRVVYFTLNLI